MKEYLKIAAMAAIAILIANRVAIIGNITGIGA